MRRVSPLIPIALIGSLGVAAVADGAPSERIVKGWNPMSVTFAGKKLAFATSEAAVIRPGGYVVHRTDTFSVNLAGARFSGRNVEGIVLRTSAGRTTAGPLTGDAAGHHLLTATGSGFTPQLIFCCSPNPLLKDLPVPVEAGGRIDGPVTIAATIDGPLVRYVRANAGTYDLVSYAIDNSPLPGRTITPLTGDIGGNLAGIAPGIVAWVDRSVPPSLHLAGTSQDQPAAVPGPVIALPGQVLRLHVSDHAVATLVRLDSGGVELIRYDPPTWTPTVVWTGTTTPALTALGDRTLAIVDGGVLQQQVIGGTRRNIYKLRGKAVALSTDGTRIAVVERRSKKVKRKTVKESAIVIVPVRQPPGAYVPGVAQ